MIMENSPTVIRSPPPFFASSPPLSQPVNTTNSPSPPPPPPLPFSSSPQVYPIDQNGAVTISTLNPPPPAAFPDSSKSFDLSPIEFILALMAFITIPAIVYALFFAVKCPLWTSRREHDDDDHQDSRSRELPTYNHGSSVSGFKYQKQSHCKEIGIECSVCLSGFGDGEEVKQLSGCKHSFHATCIDLWLQNHNNCPICRASVAVKRPNANANANNNNNNNRTARSGSARYGDLHQGLPDAANLV